MKSKIFAAGLMATIAALTFCLLGCNSNQTNPSEQNSTESLRTINFDQPVILVDDDLVTVEVLNFFEEEITDAQSGKMIEKNYTLKVTNNFDHEINVRLSNGYVGNDKVTVGFDSGTPDLKMGKSAELTGMAFYDGTQGRQALNSLDDLYNLEFEIEVLVYSEDGKYFDGDLGRDYEIEFSDFF